MESNINAGGARLRVKIYRQLAAAVTGKINGFYWRFTELDVLQGSPGTPGLKKRGDMSSRFGTSERASAINS